MGEMSALLNNNGCGIDAFLLKLENDVFAGFYIAVLNAKVDSDGNDKGGKKPLSQRVVFKEFIALFFVVRFFGHNYY